MNRDALEGEWKQLKGKAHEHWGRLTDDDIDQSQGRTEQLAGAIQKRYGVSKEEADKQIDEFCQSCR
jgi:uncharacterized protein YjbJ (UPF0337 family)